MTTRELRYFQVLH